MNISLTPELEQYVQAKVNSGLYTSASEVIRESLRLMHTYEAVQAKQHEKLNQDIQLGLDQLSHHETISGSDSYQKIKRKLDRFKQEGK